MNQISKILIALIFLFPVFGVAKNFVIQADSVVFICNELLGRPTASSVTVNASANKTLDVYYEFGTDSLNYSNQTAMKTCQDSIPFVFVIDQLKPNTQYFYRMRYRLTGTSIYSARSSHKFFTQRKSGKTFTFAIEADPHLDTNSIPASFNLTLNNILSANPDFLIDLGDTFMSEKLPVINQVEITKRHLLFRSFWDSICHSVPIFLVLGNHEGELGWMLDGTANSLPVMASNTRKYYYPNPEPDSFYSGNTKSENFVGLRENYYAWEWGNALFVVLDPFWYTQKKPGWGWTLGADQYNWFKNTLTSSKAKFKFVFCHNLVGGNGNDARGGTEFVHLFETGGNNADSTWGFTQYRSGWYKPIHQLMVENNVNIFFHGHDHLYDKQEKDGVIYQEVPQPSNRNLTNTSAAQYGYLTGTILPGRGYLLVTITDSTAKIDYIKTYLPNEEKNGAHNRDIGDSYTIGKSGATDVEESQEIPSDFVLSQNFPNPFHQKTTINYAIPTAENVQLQIFDVFGREIITLVNEFQQAGSYSVNLTTEQLSLTSGMYFYRLRCGNYSETRAMLVN